ncbi:hypothetical protein MAHJHV65_22920 [Mycobacterium avium subsp. hominissuis]
MAHRFVGDLVRGALADHIADRGGQRRAQGDQRSDINLRHVPTPPPRDPSGLAFPEAQANARTIRVQFNYKFMTFHTLADRVPR